MVLVSRRTRDLPHDLPFRSFLLWHARHTTQQLNPARYAVSGAALSNAIMLEVRHLTKHYSGLPVVDDVSFQLKTRKILGYLGPNGLARAPR